MSENLRVKDFYLRVKDFWSENLRVKVFYLRVKDFWPENLRVKDFAYGLRSRNLRVKECGYAA